MHKAASKVIISPPDRRPHNSRAQGATTRNSATFFLGMYSGWPTMGHFSSRRDYEVGPHPRSRKAGLLSHRGCLGAHFFWLRLMSVHLRTLLAAALGVLQQLREIFVPVGAIGDAAVLAQLM